MRYGGNMDEINQLSPYKHIVRSQQFSHEFLQEVFQLATEMKANETKFRDALKGKIVAMLFYEPSTRTRLSFESAAVRLGADKITTENAKEFSSAAKGETIEDTIKVLNAYADFIIIRHFENDAAEKAIATATKPIINAGTGKGQHPTQALLDLFTIYENFGKTSGLTILFVGDLLRGRTVNSLVYLLAKYPDNKFIFVSPENCRIKDTIKEHLHEHNIDYTETDKLQDVLDKADVMYVTRVQKERFDDPQEYEETRGKFIINKQSTATLRKDAIIMHPLPRIDEISTEIDEDPRAKYFEQAHNGVYVRMALLKLLNEKSS